MGGSPSKNYRNSDPNGSRPYGGPQGDERRRGGDHPGYWDQERDGGRGRDEDWAGGTGGTGGRYIRHDLAMSNGNTAVNSTALVPPVPRSGPMGRNDPQPFPGYPHQNGDATHGREGYPPTGGANFEFDEQMKLMRDQIDLLKGSLRERSDSKDIIEDEVGRQRLREEERKLRAEIEDHRNSAIVAEEQRDEMRRKVAALEDEKRRALDMIEDEKRRAYDRAYDEQKKKLSAAEDAHQAALSALKQEKDNLEVRLGDLVKKVQEEQAQAQRMRDALNARQMELTQVNVERTRIESELRGASKQLEREKNSSSSLLMAKEELEQKFRRVEDESRRLKSEVSGLQSDVRKEQEKHEELKSEKMRQQQAMEERKKDIEEKQRRLDDSEAEIKKLKRSIEELKEEKDDVKKKAEKERRKELEEKESEISELNGRLAKFKRMAEEAQAESGVVGGPVKRYERDPASPTLRGRDMMSFAELEAEKNELHREIKKLKQDLEEEQQTEESRERRKAEYIKRTTMELEKVHEEGQYGLVSVTSLTALLQVTHGDILKSLRELLKKYSDIHLIAYTKECEANGVENIYAKSEGDERGRLRERWDDAKPLTWSESEIQLLDMNRCKQIVHAIENSFAFDLTRRRMDDDKQKIFEKLFKAVPNKAPLFVSSLEGNATNMMPKINDFLFPIDKQDVTSNDGKMFELALSVDAFDAPTSGKNQNTKLALQKFKEFLTAKFGDMKSQVKYISLFSSPVKAVTDSHKAREIAHIPQAAAFYSYCYPYEFTRTVDGTTWGSEFLAEDLQAQGIKTNDPFVTWILCGGFIYYDYIYEILAINAFASDDGVPDGYINSCLYLGVPTRMMANCVQSLKEKDRWRQVTHKKLVQHGFHQFVWVTPSEMINNTIFTRNGGFAYRKSKIVEIGGYQHGEAEKEVEYWFFPVVDYSLLDQIKPTEWESPVHIPEYINYFRMLQQGSERIIAGNEREDIMDFSESKYVPDVSALQAGEGNLSALGVSYVLDQCKLSLEYEWVEKKLLGHSVDEHSPQGAGTKNAGLSMSLKFLAAQEGGGYYAHDTTGGVEAIIREFIALCIHNYHQKHVAKKGNPYWLPSDMEEIYHKKLDKKAKHKKGKHVHVLPTGGAASHGDDQDGEAEHSQSDSSRAEKARERDVWEMLDQDRAWMEEEDWQNLIYILKEEDPTGIEVMGNDGNMTTRDRGRKDISFDFFCRHPEAREAQLLYGEVLALRLYTTSSFKFINGPLREASSFVSRNLREQKAIRRATDKEEEAREEAERAREAYKRGGDIVSTVAETVEKIAKNTDNDDANGGGEGDNVKPAAETSKAASESGGPWNLVREKVKSGIRRQQDMVRVDGHRPTVHLPATTLLISSALKKLRVQNLNKEDFMPTELWRGMKNVSSSEVFVRKGGAEGACMSSTPNLRVVASYSKSNSPLLLKIKIESPMDHGADISWLSVFPDEQEVLYPPLTFLKPVRVQPIREMDKGQVITVKPSFPS